MSHAGLTYDSQAAERLIAIYRTPDVAAQRRNILQALAPQPGERVLDVGTGPGFVAAELAAAVGPSGWVCGVDISEPMLSLARAHCQQMPWVDFRPGEATRLPFAEGQFDIAVCSQVLEYVRDLPAALAEMHRVLCPGGRALILDTDWESLVWHSTDPERMARVLRAWDEHLADPALPRRLLPALRQAGFQAQASRVMTLFNPELGPETYSHGLIGLIAAFVAGRRGMAPGEVEAWAAELHQLGAQGEYFFSLNRYLFSARKP